MTTQQLHLFNCAYLAVLVVVVYVTRPTARRIAGALAGGATLGLVCLGAIALCEALGWWQFTFTWTPFFCLLFYLNLVISGTPIFLITWRLARRFGWQGLAVLLGALAAFGPFRDYWWMAKFPEWGTYAAGVAPGLAIAATYVTSVALGHGVMRLIAGASCDDPLAPRNTLPSDSPPRL
jgi:hypothetical protein